MRKILILENEFITKDDALVLPVINYLKEKGNEVKVLENAVRQNVEEILELLNWAQDLYFYSTFIKAYEIETLGKILTKVPSLNVYAICAENLQSKLEEIFDIQTLAALSKHKTYTLPLGVYSLENSEIEEVNLSVYHDKWTEQQRIAKEQNNSFLPTGFMVKIKNVVANGHEFSNLKVGQWVPELDCSSIDPKHGRGVWVMGVNEPVRLLNEANYDEFEMELKCEALAREFLSKRGSKVEAWEHLGLCSLINDSGGKTDSEIWLLSDVICGLVNVERRRNRNYFDSRLKEYAEKHQFFSELNKPILERKLVKAIEGD